MGVTRGRKKGRPGCRRVSQDRILVLMVRLVMIVRMAVRHRLVFVIVRMLTLLLIMLVMFVGTMRVIMLHRGMLMRLVLHVLLLI